MLTAPAEPGQSPVHKRITLTLQPPCTAIGQNLMPAQIPTQDLNVQAFARTANNNQTTGPKANPSIAILERR